MEQSYENKYFYEIAFAGKEGYNLIGPLDTIRYLKPDSAQGKFGYTFAKVVDGSVVMVFKEDEIIVTNKLLVGPILQG